MDLDVDLMRLSADVSIKRRQEAELKELEERLSALRAQEAELVQTAQKEEADARKLKGRSVSHLLFSIAGKLEEKLDWEMMEAQEARARLDAVRQQIGQFEQDKAQLSKNIRDFSDCERLFANVLSRKETAILASDPEGTAGIRRLDEAMKVLESTVREIDEAVEAGLEAKKQADAVLRHLVGAERWATWGSITGSLVSDTSKYEHLESAKRETERLQLILDRFHTQLTGTQIRCDAIVHIGRFLYGADWFLGGLSANGEVLSRIRDAQDKLSDTEREVSYELERLEQLRGETEEKAAALKAERIAFIQNR